MHKNHISRLGWILFLMFTTSVFRAGVAIAVELIQDGGLEAVGVGTYTPGDLGDGWSVTSGTIPIFGPGNQYNVPQHSGTRSADLDFASTVNELLQTLTTTPGQQYLVSWWLTGDVPSPVTVTFGAQIVFNASGPSTGTLSNFAPWQQYAFTATATSTSTLLKFSSHYTFAGGGIGQVLDDVSVTPVPEPAGLAALVVVGASVRRPRRRYAETQRTVSLRVSAPAMQQ